MAVTQQFIPQDSHANQQSSPIHEATETGFQGVDLKKDISRFAVGAQLYFGATLRFGASCGTWVLWRYTKARLFGDDDKQKTILAAAEQDVKIWAGSFLAEVGISMLFVPAKYISAKTVPRLMADFCFPHISDVASIFDRFPIDSYFPLSLASFPADGSGDFDFFKWHLPATLLTTAKLILRRKWHGSTLTRTKRCIAMILLQYFIRTLSASFCVSLPNTGGELLLGLIICSLDKYLDAYLMRHTWPMFVTDAEVEAANKVEAERKQRVLDEAQAILDAEKQ